MARRLVLLAASTSAAFAAVLLAAPSAALAKRAPAPSAAPVATPAMPPLDTALAEARAAGKPLLVDFYTDWCKPCRVFEEKIFPDPRVQGALADVVFTRYDAEKGEGVAAAARYGVDGYPTFVLLGAEGQVIARLSGAPAEPTPFIGWVDRGLALSLDEATVTARLADKRTPARGLLGAARWLAAHGRATEAQAAYARAAKADKGGKLGVAPAAEWEALGVGEDRARRKRIAFAAAAYAERWPHAPEAEDASYVALATGELAPARAKKLFAARMKLRWNDAESLNHIAYVALALGDLDTALAAAQRAVELMPDQASVRDTLAEVHHYRGETDQALRASDEAIALNQEAMVAGTLRENRARFAAPGRLPSADVELEKARAAQEIAAFGAPPAALPAPAPAPAPPPVPAAKPSPAKAKRWP